MKNLIRFVAILVVVAVASTLVFGAYAEHVAVGLDVGAVGASSDDSDAGGASQVELAIAYARSRIGSSYYGGYCQMFVRTCFDAAGMRPDVLPAIWDANSACSKWLVSTSRDNIPVGAVMYFSTTEYGHSAIYLGNNRFIHALSYVVESEISSFFWDSYIGWGWQYGVEPTGTYISNDDVLTDSVYQTFDNVGMYATYNYGSDDLILFIPSGAKISVSEYYTDSLGQAWAKARYYSQTGWIKLDYCTYLYEAERSGMQLDTVGRPGKRVTGLKILQMPKKFYYLSGEKVDLKGMLLEVEYSDGSTETVSGSKAKLYTTFALDSGFNLAMLGMGSELVSVPMVISDTGDALDVFNLKSNSVASIDREKGTLVFGGEANVSDLRKVFRSTSSIWVYSSDGEQKTSGRLCTGDYICYATSSVNAVVTVVIKGDANGDGRVNAADYLIKRRYANMDFSMNDLPMLVSIGAYGIPQHLYGIYGILGSAH